MAASKILWWSPGDPKPEGEPSRYVNGNKYVRLRWKIGPCLHVETWEHIWLAGQPGMQVHHLNGDGQDNSPGNLLPCTPEQHRAIHSAQNRADEFRIIALYEAGLSQPLVGKVVGCNSGTVSRVLARNGVAARKQPWNRRGDINEAAIAARLADGDRVDAVARDMGLSREIVRRVRREHGLPSSPPGRYRKAGQ